MYKTLIYTFAFLFYLTFFLVILSTITAKAQTLPKQARILYSPKESYFLYTTATYRLLYDKTLKAPLCVAYKLYHGGGDCSRKGLTFHKEEFSASAKDYAGNGYDEGHLVNAEDFAYNCKLEALTFSFYNCAPQTPQLNRGIWKVKESGTRSASQFDSLNVVIGSIILRKHKVIGNGVTVPSYYYRIVQSLTTKEIKSCSIYSNTAHPTLAYITVDQLQDLVPYRLPIK